MNCVKELSNEIYGKGYLIGRTLGVACSDAEIIARQQESNKYHNAYLKAQETAKNNLKLSVKANGFSFRRFPKTITSEDLIVRGFPGGKNAVHTLMSHKDLIKEGGNVVLKENLIKFFKD
jgi:hypothetical protein